MNRNPLAHAWRTALPVLLLTAVAVNQPAAAQTPTDAARAEGKAFGKELSATAQRSATAAPDAGRIPNFSTTPDGTRYAGDPEALARDGTSEASRNSGYQTMRDSMDRRVRFDPVDIEAVIARSKAIGSDPLTFTSGMSVSGSQGRCVPLPTASGSAARYKATCNTGYKLESGTASCAIPLTVSVTEVATYRYYAEVGGHTGLASALSEFGGAMAAGLCRDLGPTDACAVTRAYGYATTKNCATFRSNIVECSADPGGLSGLIVPATGAQWFAKDSTRTATTARDETACSNLAADSNCTVPTETCTESDPATRVIDGAAVTQPCWAWRRDYQCNRYTPAQDCTALEAAPGCVLQQEYCLTDDTPCRTNERVYDCPVPDGPATPPQFICDGDVYCIDGACETIEREANTEFKDAVTALNAVDQARRELDPDNLTLFKGSRETCSSKVFGILNCCKGKGFPLIPGIQLLVSLGCNREEMLLHERDAGGLCAYVGTYCSSSVLGICLTKRKTYCCFASKLSRILQEQGRVQLAKPWGPPKVETCAGLTVAEFAQLDLSVMDFSEVYAEFTGAARLPDELEAANQIQQKIEDYYARSRP